MWIRSSAPATDCRKRRGAVMVFAAAVLILMFAFVAFSVDVGYMAMVKGQLQNAADAASLAGVRDLGGGEAAVRTAAKSIALENEAAGAPVALANADIEIGVFNFATKSFVTTGGAANAIRVTARVDDQPLFFGPVLQARDFDMSASAIAMLNPRDIVFVVDLSGSMNDDTEPVWATQTINAEFAATGYPNVATGLMQDLYNDFGFGTFPGVYQHIGVPFGLPADAYAYAEMTKDNGPLTSATLSAWYRIDNADDEDMRRVKAYRWIIDHQIATLMPAALPTPNSSVNFAYWEKYLDYVINGAWVGTPPPPPPDDGGGGGGGGGDPPTPPLGMAPWNIDRHWAQLFDAPAVRQEVTVAGATSAVAVQSLLSPVIGSIDMRGMPRRGGLDYVYVPPWYDDDRISEFNNPNRNTFPATTADPYVWQNTIGYVTYVQFMLDWGRDRSPAVDNSTNSSPAVAGKTPLSLQSPHCPLHYEATAGGTFQFPPRTQPMHAARRAMIAAINLVKVRNANLTSGYGDRVAIVTYDSLDAYHTPQLLVPLTADFDAAMLACTQIQEVSDIGASTATEAGLIVARNHLKPVSQGGAARAFADKVIVLLTDGVPNAWTSTGGQISSHVAGSSKVSEYYGLDYPWYNAALMQAELCSANHTDLHPVGIGLGTDYNFMDRMARLAGTAEGGLSVRGSGNPAEYEQRLIEIFEEIVKNPGGRLVR